MVLRRVVSRGRGVSCEGGTKSAGPARSDARGVRAFCERQHQRKRLTYEDFLLFPDDGKRHELIDGEHYVTPSSNTRLSGRLFLVIGSWLEAHPIGQVFYAPFDVVLSNFDVVEPDLLYMSNERAAEVLTAKHLAGAPELVIEIASPGTRKRDETLKRRLYERTGVTEYWVVDPELNAIRVFRRSGEQFDRPVEMLAEAGDVLTSSLLPGLDIPLQRVFASDAPAKRGRST